VGVRMMMPPQSRAARTFVLIFISCSSCDDLGVTTSLHSGNRRSDDAAGAASANLRLDRHGQTPVVYGIGVLVIVPQVRPARIFVLIVMIELLLSRDTDVIPLLRRDAAMEVNRSNNARAAGAAGADLRLDLHGRTPLVS
jgi:hypothetical protein